MQQTRHPHLAIEALRRLVEQEMRRVTRHNVIRQQSFSDRLIALMTRYTNQNLAAAQMIAELVAMAKEVSAHANRGQEFSPPLTTDELAFYDAVAQNESAVTEMGTGVLADIARDLVKSLRRDVTTDWVSRDDVRPSSAPPSSACWPATATPLTPSRPLPSWSYARWRPSPRNGPPPPTGDSLGAASTQVALGARRT
jgi:type I site-specific restriction-modification system R (restriction) subunit